MKVNHLPFSKIISFFLVVAVVVAGCTNKTPAVATPTLSVPGESNENVVITFAAEEYQRILFEPLMETFHEQNPEITVQFVDVSKAYPQNEEWNQYTYLRGLAQAADVVMIQGSYPLDMSRYFRDLRPLYESDLNFHPEDFWPGILNACEDTYGNMIGLPMMAYVNGLFYDPAAFDAAGVLYPAPGWTWEDFQKAVSALAVKKGSDIQYGYYDQPHLSGSIIAPIVSDYLRSHNGEVDAAEFLSEVKWYIDLVRAGALAGVKTDEEMAQEWEKRAKLFEDDALRPAMWSDSLISYIPGNNAVFNSASNPFAGMAIERFGFAPSPVASDGSMNQTNRSWVECAAVSAGSAYPRAAWAWLNFLSNHWLVVEKTLAHEYARAPARQSVAESSGYLDFLPEKVAPAVRYVLEHGSYDYSYADQFNEINLALVKTISENADFQEALEAAIASRPAQPTPSASDNAPIVVATPVAPPPEGVTVIKYFNPYYNPYEGNAMEALIEQYNERSEDTHVTLVSNLHGNPGEDFIGSLASESDCFTASAPYWESFDATRVLNLNSLLSNEPASFASDFSPEIMDRFRQEGNLYGLPASSQVQMMAYNADLLARRGLSAPANDWDFDDFLELASAAASTSDSDPSYGFMYYSYDEFLWQGKGVKWLDVKSNPPQINFDSPEVLDQLRWLSNLKQERVLFYPEEDGMLMDTVMREGQLAFWTTMMGEEASYYYVPPGEKPPYKIGMAPLPKVIGDSSLYSFSNDLGHYISAQSQAPQACWDWLKFLSEQPTVFKGFPARRSIAESPAWEASVGKENAVAYKAALDNVKPVEPVNIEIQQVMWPLSRWMGDVIKAAFEGQELQPVLIAKQLVADDYLGCALTVDTSRPYEEFNVDLIECLRQADPDGNW